MAKKSNNFWLGLGLGVLGGVVAARRLLETQPMPNARNWQRILAERLGEVEAAVFMARVQRRYEALKSERPRFYQLVFDTHMTGNILPGLALYQVLREDGLGAAEAIEEVDRIFETWFKQFPPLNLRLNQLMKSTPENFDFFRRLTRLVTDKLFPAPGWRYDLVQDDENGLAFNMHHCFYLDVLAYYGAPELTPVFCRLDDYLMNAMPESIQWRRTQTLAMGGECCDFRWDYEPRDG